MKLALVVAMTKKGVIGKQGKLPWSIPEEMQLFKKITLGKTVIMGRKTFESIGSPLPRRNNIVVSTTMKKGPGITVVRSCEQAVNEARKFKTDAFIIGGSRIYEETLPLVTEAHVSFIKKNYAGDVAFPYHHFGYWKIVKESDHEKFRYVVFEKEAA